MIDNLKYKNKFLAIYALLGIAFIVFISLNFILQFDVQININIISIFVILLLFIQMVLMREYEIPLLSSVSVFLVFSYIFNFSHLILQSSLFKFTKLGGFVINVVGYSYFFKAIIFCYLTIYIMFLGVLSIKRDRSIYLYRTSTTNTYYLDDYLELTKKLGTLIFSISIPFFLYISLGKLYVSLTKGYLDIFAFQQSIFSSFNFLSTMMSVGLSYLMIGFKDNLIKSRTVLILGTLLQMLNVLSGSRGIAVISIIMYFFVYFVFVQKLKLKNCLIISLVGYILLTFLNIIAVTRVYDGIITLNVLLNIISTNFFYRNPIFVSLNEFGSTLLTTSLVIKKVPLAVSPGYGLTYLNSFLNLLRLNIGGDIIPNFAVHLNYPTIGGSFIGELYYNFLWFGSLASYFIGCLVSYFSKKIEEIKFSQKYYKLGLYLPFFLSSIWWVRDGFQYLVRYSVVGYIFVYFLIRVLIKKIPID